MKKSLIIGKRQFLLAALVLILALAVYLNWRLSNGGSQNVTDVYAGGTLGQAVLVDSDSAAEQDYFAKSKADREESRSKQLSELKEISEGVKTDGESAQKASEQMVKISGYREKENNIETLVKAKGFENCTAVNKRVVGQRYSQNRRSAPKRYASNSGNRGGGKRDMTLRT